MEQVGALLRRLASTRWGAAEVEAFSAAGLGDMSAFDFADELKPLAAYYGAKLPADRDYRRRDVLRLLKNWSGELDRARSWQRENDDGLIRT
jgi:hypothetical protein